MIVGNASARCRYHYTKSKISGASLLLTLVVIAGILILFTIMARLVMVERRVSRGYSELQRADMAAQAGAADAENLLLHLFKNWPDSATYWEPRIADTSTPGTVFMFRDQSPDKDNGAGGTSPKIYARPLLSAAASKEYYPSSTDFKNTLPSGVTTDPEKSVDLNESKRFGGSDPNGWIGAVPGKAPVSVHVPWVEILEDPAQAESDTNRVVARYAWWVDDESFKLNVNTAKALARGDADSETKTVNGKVIGDPKPTLQGLFAQDVATAVTGARDNLAVTGQRFLSAMQVGHASIVPGDTTQADFGRDYKFLLTTESSGLNLSRSGFKRLDLNDVVDRSVDGLGTDASGRPDLGSGSAPGAIRKALDRIIVAIKANAPHFGQRFYRLSATQAAASNYKTSPTRNTLDVSTGTSAPHETRYVEKIAANIYDYISPAANPTVVDHDGNVCVGAPVYSLSEFDFDMSAFPVDHENPFNAIGKKNIPYFSEYMVSVKSVLPFTKPSIRGGVADYTLQIDHYLEFWNLTDKTIRPAEGDLGPDPYIIIENQPGVAMNDDKAKPGEDIPVGRPFEIKLDKAFTGPTANLEFAPNQVTVITTDPNYTADFAFTNLGVGGKTVYVAGALYRPGTSTPCDGSDGQISSPDYPSGEGSASVPMPNARLYQCTSFRFSGDGSENGEIQVGPRMEGANGTKILLGNRYGLMDAHPSIALEKVTNKNLMTYIGAPGTHFRGCYLGGSRVGDFDPRGSLEALNIRLESGSVTGAYSSLVSIGSTKTAEAPQNSNLGSIGKVTKSFWDSDVVSFTSDAVTTGPNYALAVVANAPMRSIGELGNIFDPIRYGMSANVLYYRSGARTMTVGQPDVLWDGTRPSSASEPEMSFQVSRSRNWAAWRLADIFTVKPDADMRGDKANPANRTEIEGLYNPNGILRDEGKVLKALVKGFQFSGNPKSDPALQGKEVNSNNTDVVLAENKRGNFRPTDLAAGGNALANYLAARLSRSVPKRFSPIWEPGEISQLDMFNPDTNKLIDAGIATNALNDRGREELSRRLMDLITPKGNTFSIYVVGQSMDRKGNPTATKAQRVLVRLRPVFDPPLKADFNPQSEAADRFRAPDAYKLEVIGVEQA